MQDTRYKIHARGKIQAALPLHTYGEIVNDGKIANGEINSL